MQERREPVGVKEREEIEGFAVRKLVMGVVLVLVLSEVEEGVGRALRG